MTVAEGIVTSDPFRDVIRTEPAPNLQSLMGDIMPFLARQTSTTTTTTIQPPTTTKEPTKEEDTSFSFDNMFKFLFSEENNEEQKEEKESNLIQITTVKPETTTEVVVPSSSSSTTTQAPTSKEPSSPKGASKVEESKNSIDPSGLLKLAGCNIYGRMYRVGRIISELSGPCLECKCTDIGVQCRNLKC